MKDDHVGKTNRKKSRFKTILMVIAGFFILGLLSIGYIYGNRFLNSREKDVISVAGVSLVDNESPENEIIQKYENVSEEIRLDQEENIEKEKERLEKQIQSFRKAIASKNPRKIASHFIASEEEKYKKYFTENKDNLGVFEEIFSNMTLEYLGNEDVASGDDLYKIAEYTATWNDYNFSIVFIKEDNKWLIMGL